MVSLENTNRIITIKSVSTDEVFEPLVFRCNSWRNIVRYTVIMVYMLLLYREEFSVEYMDNISR
mgnify:CR=1 FL=1